MINKAKLQLSIQSLVSILILMTLFMASAHATSCHNIEQGVSQSNQKHIDAHKNISANVVVEVPAEVSITQNNSHQCCKGICKALCSSHNFPHSALLVSGSFEKKYKSDVLKTNYYFNSELEQSHKNLKSQNYYRNNHFTAPPLLQTTLKHRVLHI